MGRQQALLAARELAEKQRKGHFTHIFLHDAGRRGEQIIGQGIMGTNAETYLGDVRPSKGMYHWRVGGTTA